MLVELIPDVWIRVLLGLVFWVVFISSMKGVMEYHRTKHL